ncbi:MAG: hypothetical protein LBJ31_00400 [Treponema sp.]|nr:hypothetical protein [Treponema sp.]
MGQYDSWEYLTAFIKTHRDTFARELAKPPYAVKTKPHSERPNLVMFKYSQFESDFSNPVVRCCRGSVYYIDGETVKPYLMPFFKFSNFGEKGEDPVDWKGNLYVRDKLDGSLIKLLKEPRGGDLWTTNGSFDLDAEIPESYACQTNETLSGPFTFRLLLNYALRDHEKEIAALPGGWTFMFELTSPYNRIIVPYHETRLTLLGCRDEQGKEHTPEWAAREFALAFKTPEIYPLKGIDEVIAYCRSVDVRDREGVVVQDKNFNRVKIKTEHYLSLFHIKGEDHFSDSGIFEAVKKGIIDDALAAWPEIRPVTEKITAEWTGFINAVHALCEKAKAVYVQKAAGRDPRQAKKEYAMFVLDTYGAFSTFLFEAVKDTPGLESIFNKIEYTELKSFWLPAARSIDG